MFRAAPKIVLLLLLFAGCTKEQDYLDVNRAQRANWHEVADILETIKDEKTMAEAKTALQEREIKYEAIARRIEAMPKPPPAVLKRMEEDHLASENALRRLMLASSNVSKLPGGKEFLEQFKSSKGLLSAVQR